jgi:hypothetical protein
LVAPALVTVVRPSTAIAVMSALRQIRMLGSLLAEYPNRLPREDTY